jgi:hypothetical protein
MHFHVGMKMDKTAEVHTRQRSALAARIVTDQLLQNLSALQVGTTINKAGIALKIASIAITAHTIQFPVSLFARSSACQGNMERFKAGWRILMRAKTAHRERIPH